VQSEAVNKILQESQRRLYEEVKKAGILLNFIEFEITLEANPDDISQAKLTEWKSLGINRLSIGIQSFKPGDLYWMNRAHTAEESLNCVVLAQKNGFTKAHRLQARTELVVHTRRIQTVLLTTV
jgi:coproporphyrinogen III oxidase-like Fe-S oxidoreductase